MRSNQKMYYVGSNNTNVWTPSSEKIEVIDLRENLVVKSAGESSVIIRREEKLDQLDPIEEKAILNSFIK